MILGLPNGFMFMEENGNMMNSLEEIYVLSSSTNVMKRGNFLIENKSGNSF